MPTAQTTKTFEVDVPPLRTFLHVNADRLHPNVRDTLERQEGRADYVDAGLPRDWEITEEIRANTIGAALVDSEGEVLYEQDGPDAQLAVTRAMEGAKVTVELNIPTPKIERAVREGRTPRPDVKADEPEGDEVSI